VKRRRQARPNRASGFQLALRSHAALLSVWEETLSPDEFAQLLDVIERVQAHARRRHARWLRRIA
jgi:hypothetical protein